MAVACDARAVVVPAIRRRVAAWSAAAIPKAGDATGARRHTLGIPSSRIARVSIKLLLSAESRKNENEFRERELARPSSFKFPRETSTYFPVPRERKRERVGSCNAQILEILERSNHAVTFQRASAPPSAAVRPSATRRPVSVPATLCSPLVTVPRASRATGT